ncbi:hypothetical protein PRIC2_002615 [Phytophthora ramorum]
MDAQIIELPESYSVDNERLGIAIAHVSAQASRLAEVLTDRQAEQEQRQKQFVEERVAQARMESEARTQALVCAINEAYGDPTALERRVDDRIQRVLTTLQESSLRQAREMAEAQLAEQEAAHRTMEEKINEALVDVQERAALRAEQSVQALVATLNSEHQQLQQSAASDRHQLQTKLHLVEERTAHAADLAGEKARVAAVAELDARLEQALMILEERVVRRAETHLVELVKSLLEENRRQCQRQQLEQQSLIEERLEQRLRETIVVAKKAADTQAREVVATHAAAQSSYSVEAHTEATMTWIVDESVHGSITLRTARLEAQRDVVERALRRAKELLASAAHTKRARERSKRPSKATPRVTKSTKAPAGAEAARYA